MNIDAKLQDIFHWITIVTLWVGSLTPAIYGIVHNHLTGQELVLALVSTIITAINNFNYYATTTQGITPPTPPTV